MTLPRPAVLALLLAACGRSGFESVDGGSGDSGNAAIAVGPLYANAPGFTDWVENDGADVFSATGVPCNGNLIANGGPRDGQELGRKACVLVGPLRATLVADTACDDLVVNDTLGALDWACRQQDADALIYSRGLHAGRSLRDLLDATAWRPNALEIRRGDTLIANSDPGSFWPNEVMSLDDTVSSELAIELSGAGIIYTLGTDRALPALTLTAPGSAFVTLGTTTLSPASTQPGCATGEGVGLDNACAIAVMPTAPYAVVSAQIDTTGTGVLAVDPSFVTIASTTIRNAATGIDVRAGGASEVTGVDLGDVDSGIIFSNGAYNAVRGARVIGKSTGTGIGLDGGRHHAITHATVIGAFDNIAINGSTDARLHDVESAHSGEFGIYVGSNSTHATLTDIVATNSGFDAVRFIDGANDGTLVGALIANSQDDGAVFWGVLRPTVSHVTSIANFQFGVNIYLGSHSASVSQINAANNGDYGLFVRASSFGLFSQIAVTNNAFQQSRIYQGSDFNTFMRAYIGGPGTVCAVDGGGVDNNTIVSDNAGVICGGDNPTYDFRSAGGLTQATTFGGLVVTDATNANASAFAGMQPVDPTTITDWTNFDTPYRFWGRGASASFLDAANRLNCIAPNPCRAWDASLLPTSPLYNTSGTGRSANEPFVDGASCPSAVQGDYTMHDLRGTEIAGDGIGDDDGTCEVFEKCDAQSVYLVNAREIIEDDIGDDDGLCESNEACVYSPNFGYFQGTGEPTARCTFADGSGAFGVTNVAMYGR